MQDTPPTPPPAAAAVVIARWLWPAALSLLALALVLLVALPRGSEPVENAATAVFPSGLVTSAAEAAPAHGPVVWPEIDRELRGAFVAARARALAEARQRLDGLVDGMRRRVAEDFLPWYLSFARRKIEELRAYNLFALDKLHGAVTGRHRDTASPALIATFEEQFGERVLAREATRTALGGLAQDVADRYGAALADEMRQIQRRHGVPFAEWTRHLDALAPLVFTGADGRPVPLPVAELVNPGPGRVILGEALAEDLLMRFDRLPAVADRDHMIGPDGRSVFAVGENAGLYFGSYLVYWAVLLILVQSGVVPGSLFGALIGWVIWEIFAWGTWIGYEALDFEQTRAALAPVIGEHLVAWLDRALAVLGDVGPGGAFRTLYQFDAWSG